MRALVAAVLLLAATPARAALEVCASERAEAATQPPAAEDVRAYERCVERWRDVLPRAEAELAKPPPQHLEACDGPFARWQSAAAVAPENYEAMVRRLAARDENDRCVGAALAPKEPLAVVAARIAAEQRRAQAAQEHSEARGWVVAGAILLGFGGTGLVGLGGAGIAILARGGFGGGEGPVAEMIFGIVGIGSAVMACGGALLLGFGARRLRH